MLELNESGEGQVPAENETERTQAMDRLLQKDRILLEARMLPTDRKLHARELQAVRDKLTSIIHDENGEQTIPYSRIAEELGISPASLSQWMAAKYRGNNDKVAHAVNIWMERHVRRAQSQGHRDYIETWACEEMMAVVNLADRRQKMAAIVAPSGSGKDMVIDVLCERLNGFVIQCGDEFTPRQLLQEWAERMGLHTTGATRDIKRRIIKRLKDKSCIVFLNEAQTLRRQCAGVIRSVYDQTNVPIIMMGSHDIFAFIDDRTSGGGQFARRTIKCNIESRMMLAADPDDPKGERVGRALYSKAEIRKFLAMKQVRLADDDAFRMLANLANMTKHGTLGLVAEVVDTIRDLFEGEAITTQYIAYALRLHMEDGSDGVISGLEAADHASRSKQTRRAATA